MTPEDWTAVATVVIAAFTVILALGGGYQAVLTRRAINETNRQHVASNRAFVFISRFNPLWLPDPSRLQPDDPTLPKTVISWAFRPQWQNSGNTQTKNMVTYVDSEFRDSPLPHNFPFTENQAFKGKLLVGPKNDASGGQSRNFTIAELQQVQAGTHFIYLWGWTRYEDIFGPEEHITRYCVEPIPVGDPTKSNATWNFRVTLIGNCADSECVAQNLG